MTQWTPQGHSSRTKDTLADDDLLAKLSVAVDEEDEEVSRIVPGSTPSTATSTPTPPYHSAGPKQRAKSSMTMAPTAEETAPDDHPTRPDSVCGVASARGPGSANVRWRMASDNQRPASSAYSARAPRKINGKNALPPMSSTSPKGEARPTPSKTKDTPTQSTVSKSSQGSPVVQPSKRRHQQQPSQQSNSSASFSEGQHKKPQHLPQDPALQAVARQLNKALVAHAQKRQSDGPPSWARFFMEADTDGSGMISFEELDIAARRKLKAPVSRYELRVFWRRLDEDNSGQASVEEFGRLMYKIELSQWPDLTDDEIWRVVGVLNQAAHKWHRAGGNWFKIFNQIDADGSGNLSFDELVQCVRGTYPCLRVPTRDVKERELQGLWKALDDTGSIEVPVHRFMVFMRRWSADASFKEQKQRAPAKSSLPPVSERSGAEVRGVAQALERALSSYYIDKGYLSVASACEAAAWQGGAKVNDTACSWTRFFMEMDKDRSGRLSYGEFVRAVFSKLKTWMDPKVSLPVGGTGRNVTKEDIRALWDKLDPSSVGEVTAKDMMLGLYHVQLDGWPELDGVDLERIATIVNHAAVKRLRTSGNWYKIFNLVDKGQSGRLSFGGLREVVRDMWYGLAIPPDQITEFDLKGLWKALDEDKSSTVSVGEFMVFMRRYGAKHSMQKSSQSKMTCSVISEEDEEQKEQIANAPELDAHQLVAIATNLTLGVHSWLSRTGADKGAFAGALLWPKFIDASESSRNGRMRFTEFHKMVVQVMRPPPSLEQLMAFWREVDQEGTGEVTASHFDNAVYRLQVDTWPELDQQGIFRVIHILNTAADKWHRASGNWYKVFLACDEDGSGSMTFDEMVGVCRKNFPGLSISPQTMPERDIRGFWRALDAHRAGRVEVYDFMIFMRKYGAQLSMHRSVRNKTATTEIEDYGKPPERSDDELRHTSKVLDESLTAYWNRRGVHVRAVDKWQRFLDEADLDRDGLVTFQDLEQALIMRLKAERKFIDDNAMLAFSSKVLAQFSTDGAVVNGVSHDDLYALWCRIDADNSGRVSYKEWTNGMYRLRLDTWPVISDMEQGAVVDKIGAAASKWIGKVCWYKVFKLVDVDGSGEIGFDEFFRIIRRPLPCLAITTKEISNPELKGLWKAMDQDMSGAISVQEFMIFMRRLEVRRGFARWRPQVLQGTPVAKAAVAAEVAARAKAPGEHLSEAQLCALKDCFKALTLEDLRRAFEQWGWPWRGLITEWEWPRLVRELLQVPEDELSDDGLFTAWSKIDTQSAGEIDANALIEAQPDDVAKDDHADESSQVAEGT